MMFLSEPQIATLRPTLLLSHGQHSLESWSLAFSRLPQWTKITWAYTLISKNGCTSRMHDKLVVKIKGATVSFYLSNEFVTATGPYFC